MNIIFYFTKILDYTLLILTATTFTLSIYVIGTFIFIPYRIGYFIRNKIREDDL